MTYKIKVRDLDQKFLNYTRVESWEVIDGYLTFTDVKTGRIKRFPVSNTEIEEEM